MKARYYPPMIRPRIFVNFAIALAALLLFASPVIAARFAWQNPATHPRVIVNADQGLLDALTQHPGWFNDDFLVASFVIDDVPYGAGDGAANFYGRIRKILWRRNINFGTYVSGTTAIPDLQLTVFPPNAVSIEDMSIKTKYLGNWLRDTRQQVVDLRDLESLKNLEYGIAALWRQQPGQVRFIDNAAIHPQVYRMLPWLSYCINMALLRTYNESKGVVSIFNVFVRPWELTEEETNQLIAAVAGNDQNALSFPIPWMRQLKDDKARTAWAIYRYRQLLDHGIVIILIPSADADSYELTGWLATWRRPFDRVYIAAPYSEPPP